MGNSELTGEKYFMNFDVNPAGQWGLHVTGDIDGPIDAKWTMQKDFKQGEVNIKYKNQNYGVMQLKGDSHMEGMIPAMFDYVVKYNLPILELFINSGRTARDYQGKAKLKVDARAPTKKFEISFAPKTGKPFEYTFDFNLSSGFKYDSDLKVNGKTVEKVVGEYTWTNDADKFELESTENYSQTKENPFYELSKWMCGGHEFMAGVQTRKIFFEKGNKHHFLHKIHKSILFVPKMKMDTTLTLDGEKISETAFDNTQEKKHFKFFWAPDAFTKDYLFTDEWEYPGHSGCKWNTELKRGGVSIWNWVGDYSFVNNANKFEMKTLDKIVQTEMSPFYGLDHFYLGRYYKTGGRQRTITYEKKNRNFLLGKLFVENTITLDGEKFSQEKLDTRSTPYTMVWFSQPVRGLFPITRDITGQDEMIVSAWHTPGKELKIETNLPEVKSMKITSAGPTKKFEFNGKEVATVDFDSSSKKASHTMHLPSGKDLTIDLAWPKMTPAASDLEFGVTITPDRKVVTKFGWEMAGVKKVYLDVVGNNPWMGDYKLSRQGEFEPVSPSVYKIKWTGHGETTNGFLRRISPVETNVVTSFNMNNMKVDAIVWKSFAGKKYGFTLTNDKFLLLAGDH